MTSAASLGTSAKAALFGLCTLAAGAFASQALDQAPLSKQCPPYFELLADGSCQLRTLYDFYDSPAQHGGVQARLPAFLQVRQTVAYRQHPAALPQPHLGQ